MSGTAIELLIWVILMPLGFGGFTAWRLRSANKRNAKPGLDSRDRLEILNESLSAASFLFPVAVAFAYFRVDPSLPRLQWWAALAGLFVISCLPMFAYGRWYHQRLAAFESAGAASDPA